MPSPPLANLDDLEVWMGSLVADGDRAEAKLRAASALVRAHKGTTYLNEDDELLDVPDNVWTVTLIVAERLLTAADAVQRHSETIDGYTVDDTYAQAVGGLMLTDSEKALLGGAPSALASVKVTAPEYPNSGTCWDQILESDEGS